MKVAEVDDVHMPGSNLVDHPEVKGSKGHRLSVSLLGEGGQI
jgi:hypothetical protein